MTQSVKDSIFNIGLIDTNLLKNKADPACAQKGRNVLKDLAKQYEVVRLYFISVVRLFEQLKQS